MMHRRMAGRSEEKPLNRAETEAAWAENRRAELSYLAGQPKP